MKTRRGLKDILLSVLLLSFPLSSLGQGKFILSGEIRERGLFSHGYKSLLGPDEKGSFFVGQRTRLNFSYEQEKLGLFIQLEDGRIWGQTDGGHSPGFGIGQAYFHMDFGKGFGMKIGRMPLSYEDNRYISYSSWNEIPDNHDALMLTFRSPDKKTKAEVVGSFSNTSENTILNPYGLDDYFKYLAIAYVSHTFVPDFRWSLLSATHMNEALVPDGNGGMQKDPSKITAISTVASYFQIGAERKVSALIYAYGQFGKEADQTLKSAMLASAEIRYKVIPQLELKLAYDFVSGNNYRKMTENGTVETHNHDFDKFLGSTHSFLGIMDYFGASSDPTQGTGLHQPYLTVTYRPAKAHSLELSGRYFLSANSFFYDPLKDGTLSLMNRDLGWELALVYKYKIHRDVNLEAGYAFHTSTPTLEILNEIPAGQSKFSQFAYLMIEYRPTLFDSDRHKKKD